MPAIISEKFHVHNAHQFHESLSEGSQVFAETLSTIPLSADVEISGNVYGLLRTGDFITANNELRRVVAVAANGTHLTMNVAFSTDLTNVSFSARDEHLSYDTYYVFIGRPTPWPEGDAILPVPTDSVGNTTFDYWRDIEAFHRITANDLVHITPRYNWTSGVRYNMYDHRTDQVGQFSNTSHPQYVLTSEYQVFKCLYNGRTNSVSGAAMSTGEPTITGQDDPSDVTYAAGSPENYVWKYLYTIPELDREKYLTGDFMPVTSAWTTLDANGDVFDDASSKYTVFNAARTQANGAIMRIVVESQGSGYTNPPGVIIAGDGAEAEASTEISSGQVSAINLNYGGSGYSTATVTLTANGEAVPPIAATATAIISPRTSFQNASGIFYITNHGINLEEELVAKYMMLYVELTGRDSGVIATGNQYRRVGIIRNPVLRGSSIVASGNVYSQTTDLRIFGGQSGSFAPDEIIWQPSTNAYGVFVEQVDSNVRLVAVSGEFSSTTANTYIMGIGNGLAGGQLAIAPIYIPATPGPFMPTVNPSGASAYIDSITLPAIAPFSGDILYAEQRLPITRNEIQTEILRTILTF